MVAAYGAPMTAEEESHVVDYLLGRPAAWPLTGRPIAPNI